MLSAVVEMSVNPSRVFHRVHSTRMGDILLANTTITSRDVAAMLAGFGETGGHVCGDGCCRRKSVKSAKLGLRIELSILHRDVCGDSIFRSAKRKAYLRLGLRATRREGSQANILARI
jgi:hypothetical protein